MHAPLKHSGVAHRSLERKQVIQRNWRNAVINGKTEGEKQIPQSSNYGGPKKKATICLWGGGKMTLTVLCQQ